MRGTRADVQMPPKPVAMGWRGRVRGGSRRGAIWPCRFILLSARDCDAGGANWRTSAALCLVRRPMSMHLDGSSG